MNLAEYRVLLSRAKSHLINLGAAVKDGGSDWSEFVDASIGSRGVEIYCSDDRVGVTVDCFERGESLHGEWTFDDLDAALEPVADWLRSGDLPFRGS